MPTQPSVPADDAPDAPDVSDVVVTAVVVAHQGARWLPELEAAVRAQTRRPDVTVAADTGSTDGSADLLREWVGAQRLTVLPERTGFGDAVRSALALEPSARAGATRWVWLLHDDCAPEPEALEALLAVAAEDPQVAVAGPKVRAWTDRRLLLEVGVTIARSGRRETLLERREQDQGQHDGTRSVLAVGTAGMLVRRDVWDDLGGLDPRLPFLRDDVDLGWRANLAGHRVVCVTDAVVHHAEAGARARRPVAIGGSGGGRLHRMDREHALFVLLANLPLILVPVAAVSMTVSSLLRAVGLMLGKLPASAADEVLALLAVLGRPDRLVAARHARAQTRSVPARTALRLLAPRSAGIRHVIETVSLGAGTRDGEAVAGRHPALERRRSNGTTAPGTGPTSEDDEDLPSGGGAVGLLRRAFLRAPVGLAGVLLVLSLLAARGLIGDGRLMGGALLPAPDSAGDLWRTYLATWHPVGVGSDTAAPPYLAVLAVLGALVGGAGRAVDLLLLGAVPLSGLSAYVALAGVVRPVQLRIWTAVTYALLPPVLGSVATGRLGTAAFAALLPLAALTIARALGLGSTDPRAGHDRAVWAAVLLLALMSAFVPLTAVLVMLLAVGGAVVLRGRNLVRLAVLAVLPPVLLMPWLPAAVDAPALLLLEPGLPGPGPSDADLSPLHVLLLRPGGPGMPPLVLGAAVLLAALAALLRRDRRRPVLAGWLLALVGLAGALVVSRIEVTAPTLSTPVPAWPGPALLVAGAGLLLAAGAGAQGALQRVVSSNFGWRQPGAVLVTGLALVAPLIVVVWWAAVGAGGPLDRRDPVLLPAFVAAEGDQPDRPRTLVLRALDQGSLSYSLVRSQGPRTGDAELSPPPDGGTGLDSVVADLASGRGGDAAGRLVPYGVRFVLLRRPVSEALAQAVDAAPGMIRVSGPSGAVLWRVDYATGRLRVLPPAAAVVEEDGAPPAARVVAAGQVGARARLGSGERDRLLVLADPRDGDWEATLSGQPLSPTTYDGWAQAFLLPAEGGHLRLRHDPGLRMLLLWLQLGAVVLVAVLALPPARTGSTDDPDDTDDPEDPDVARATEVAVR